ncbi:hypothetical protein NPIL_249881 [Nephila pilipes]|uniref:Uncharacterized protein n=1 Tax=Nephila pilipes TaxID=299642 RepID=A0A8X6QCH7_NEPPI|nr:hypothetical protein NPIL_249881 [Nephila pilipes]
MNTKHEIAFGITRERGAPYIGKKSFERRRTPGPPLDGNRCMLRLSLPRRVVNLRRRKVTLHFWRNLAKSTSGSFSTIFWQSPRLTHRMYGLGTLFGLRW